MCAKQIVIDGAYAPLFDGFVVYKRGLGYGYSGEVMFLIRQFSRFLSGFPGCPEVLKKEMLDAFCELREGESAWTRKARVWISRQFALYLKSQGFNCYVPPVRRERAPADFIPYIITENEMARIIERADNQPFLRQSPKTNPIYSMLIRMLWCCGLRLSEALSLKVGDVDLDNALITVKKAKYNQTRLVPMSDSLTAYARQYWNGMGFMREAPTAYFYPNRQGGQYNRSPVGVHIKKLMLEANVTRDGIKPPRVHDVRHSFALEALKKMEADGMDIYCSLPLLAVYLGHSDIKSTEYYLRLTGAGFDGISDAMAECYANVFPEVD